MIFHRITSLVSAPHRGDIPLCFSNSERVCAADLWELLHYVVDLRGAEPDPARIQRPVRAAQHEEPAGLGVDQQVVPVGPDPGELVKVGPAVQGPILVPPEADRHGGEGNSTDQLTRLSLYHVTILVPGLGRSNNTSNN